jgi:hypothetical protein
MPKAHLSTLCSATQNENLFAGDETFISCDDLDETCLRKVE